MTNPEFPENLETIRERFPGDWVDCDTMSPEDDAILDAIWDDIGKSEMKKKEAARVAKEKKEGKA